MSKKQLQESERQEKIVSLRKELHAGDTIYTVLRHVSPSGMSRTISAYIVDGKRIRCIDWYVEKILAWKQDKNREGIKVGGCGMDMGFHLVYSLSRAVFRDTFICIGKGCPSNDHVNGNYDYTPHTHSDGGYALLQQWI